MARNASERIKKTLLDCYEGKAGESVNPLFEGFIVSICPFCEARLAMYNPTTRRFSCLRYGRRDWRKLAAKIKGKRGL